MGGLKLYDAAMRWRLHSHGKRHLTELTAIADQLAAEERRLAAARQSDARATGQ